MGGNGGKWGKWGEMEVGGVGMGTDMGYIGYCTNLSSSHSLRATPHLPIEFVFFLFLP